jgi:hypothetical protein
MKDKWKQLAQAGKVRMVVMALIAAWCAYATIEYVYEIWNLELQNVMVDTKHMGPILIDGSNFTAFFKLAGIGVNGLLIFFVYAAYTVAITLMSAVPMLLFWLIAIRRAKDVVSIEPELARHICGIGAVISFCGGVIFTGFHTKLPAVWLTLCWVLWAFFLVIIPLRKRIPAVVAAAQINNTDTQNANGGQR